MSDSQQLPPRPTPLSPSVFASTFGGILVCGWFSILLYGVSLLQTYMYFLRYSKDSIWLKLVVFSITVLSTTQIVLVCMVDFRFLVTSYSDPSVLLRGAWPVYIASLLDFIVVVAVQGFFAKLMFHLMRGMKRYILIAGFVLFVISEFAFGIAWIVKEFQSTSIAALAALIPKTLVPLRILRMLSDALTTSALCATLYDAKVHFKPSVKLVRTIIVYAMNRFILTTIIGCVQMIVMIINPHNQAILAADFISAHLYINSFLATLNARNRIRAIGTGGTFVDVSSFSEGPSGAYTFDAARSRTTNVNLPDVSAQEAEEGNLDLSDGRSKSRQRGESAGNLKRVQIEVEVEREEYVLSDMALQHEQDDQKGSAESHVV